VTEKPSLWRSLLSSPEPPFRVARVAVIATLLWWLVWQLGLLPSTR
jgi:hypothetical protein